MSAERTGRTSGALAVAWANVVALALFYGARSAALIAVGGGEARAGDRLLVVAHAAWVALLLGAVAVLLALWRRAPAALALAAMWWIALVDTQLYLLLGVHLSSSVVVRTLWQAHLLDELRLGAATLMLAALLGVVLFAVELALLWAVARRPPRRGLVWMVALAAVVASTALLFERQQRASGGVTAQAVLGALPFAELPRLSSSVGVGETPRYPRLQPGTAPRVTRPLSVLFILIESLRADAATPAIMPRLSRFIASDGNVRSLRHYSGAHSTDHALFGLLYGLGADQRSAFFAARDLIPSWPLSLLKLNGYQLRGGSASFLSGWNQTGRLMAQLDEYREFVGDPKWQNDQRLVEYARDFAHTRNLLGQMARPFFLFLFFDSTHYNYVYPPGHERFSPVLPESRDHLAEETALSGFKTEIGNRYRNSAGYVDELVGQVLDLFAQELARGELIVVVTGDHGEELWDNGLFGHAAPTLTHARIQVPLALHLPGAAARQLPLSTHADLLPTVIDALRLDPPVSPSFWSTGRSLLSPVEERAVLAHASGYPNGDRASRTLVLIDGQRKFHAERLDGPMPRYRLLEVTDLDDRPLAVDAATVAAFERWVAAAGRDSLRFVR